ncbi:Rieske 2Fe-2S domain-containing protein [Microbacterium sp. LTA6]|uniref:Rieske (2Fe-2S) protein n=1 Tax=unclassified Microbacterium TaxID=2609290 RepID=UPI003139B483
MSARVVRRDVVVARLDDLKERERIVVDVDGTELGLYFYADQVRAWYNVCPHQGGPVCQGKIMPRTVQLVREDLKSGGPGFHPTDRNIVCPWHGFEFDVLTGKHPADASVGLRPIPVRVDGNEVVVTL